MTQNQKKIIENEFFRYPNNENEVWATVFMDTKAKFRYENEEILLDMIYIQHKQRYNIMKTLKITKDGYYYSLRKIHNFAFVRARELNLI